MKFLSVLILSIALAFVAGLYLPWWSIAPACFVVAFFIPLKHGWSLLAGFLGIALFWGGMSFWLSEQNNHILAHKVSVLILKKDDPTQLMWITALLGGIIGGLSAWSGALLRSGIKKKK
ncbi:MAG TPA: hypothetical protein PKK69_03795 [Ferruginibacter sp.]|nr:hypothetical protein [Ferruginibacter sp.]